MRLTAMARSCGFAMPKACSPRRCSTRSIISTATCISIGWRRSTSCSGRSRCGNAKPMRAKLAAPRALWTTKTTTTTRTSFSVRLPCRMKRLIFIVVLTILAVFVVWPQKPGNYIPGGDALPGNPGIHLPGFDRQGAKLGLDLQGGTQLTLQADLSQVPSDQQSTSMQGVLNIIGKRVNAYGVAEPEIQQLGTDRIIVQLPGLKDTEEAKKLSGQTA